MSIVKNIDYIITWAEENICSKIKFKVPPSDESEPSEEGYDYQLINPIVFAMAMPTNEKLYPNPPIPIPSLCVSLVEGNSNMTKNSGDMKIRFSFSTWNPGEHGKDLYIPTFSANLEKRYTVWDTEESREYFKKNSDGWRDSWNFVDIALRELSETKDLGQLRIMKENGIKFGPFMNEDDEILEFYPYWFAWVEFSVEYLAISGSKYEKIL